MALPLPISNNLSQLIDTFSIANSQGKDRLRRKLITILKDHFPTNSDLATQQRFEGIEEKCRILNNNELADALLVPYGKLIQWRIPWKFDVLSFLQHLSDNPVQKTRLEYLDRTETDLLPVELTWNDILRDDPFDKPEIWKDIDYAASSSEGSLGSVEDSQDDQDTLSNVAPESDVSIRYRAEVDEKALSDIVTAREVFLEQDSTTNIQVTETQLIKETLCMLHDIPSIIYDKNADRIIPRGFCSIRDVSKETIHDCLETFSKLGTMLHSIRRSTEQRIKDPLLQSFQACLLEILEAFDMRLSIMEQNIIKLHTTVYTLMTLLVDIESESLLLKLLTPLIPLLSKKERSFTLLDSLFDLVGQRQSIGDLVSYKSVGSVFFRCFHTYLRPVRVWLEEGVVDDQATPFFVKQKHENPSTVDIWHNQFQLDLDDQNQVLAPKFIRSSIQKIFATGKGVGLLQALDYNYQSSSGKVKAMPTFDMVHGNSFNELESFEDLFEHVFEDWLSSKCSVSEAQVLSAVTQYGQLEKTTTAIEYLFLSKDGALSQQFAYTLFDHMNRNDLLWRNDFWLSELCRDCFKNIPNLDTTKISVRCTKNLSAQVRQQSMQEISMIRLEYVLHWSTAIVIQPRHINIFRSLSVLLLQLRRASRLLDRHNNPQMLTIDLNRQLILSLRHRFRWFVNLLLSHLTLNAIDGAIKKLHEASRTAQSLDRLIMLYDEAIIHIEESCLVGSSHHVALSAIVALLDQIVQFSHLCITAYGDQARSTLDRSNIDKDQPDNKHRQYSNKTSEEISIYSKDTLKGYSIHFEESLSRIITGMQDVIGQSANSSLQILLDSIESGLNKC